MVDYVRLARTADRLITRNGRQFEIFSKDGALIDPAKPWNGKTPQPPETLRGVFVPPNTVRQFGLTALGQGTEINDLVSNSEEIAITFPGQLDLRQFSHVNDRGSTWGIIGLQVLQPADTALLAFIGVRR